jgi:hypothetical protein
MEKERRWPLGIIAFVAIFLACTTIPYSDDSGFLVSAQADSPEFPVFINGKICKDTDGIPGLCSKRVKSDEPVTFRMDPRPYSYTLQLACTKDLGVSQSFSVEKGQEFSFVITPDKFSTLRSFICIGEVLPGDRDFPVSAKWETRIKVVDQAYVQRETAYFMTKKKRTFLILGEHAETSMVFDQGEWKEYKKKTAVEIKGDPTKVQAFSESHNMRFNSVGF